MGGIVIDIWEKSNFFWSFGSQKGANAIFVQGGALKAPPYGRVNPKSLVQGFVKTLLQDHKQYSMAY